MKTVGANVSRTTGALALLGGLGGGEADPRQVWNPEYVRVGGELTRQMRRGADARRSFQVEVDWAQPYRAAGMLDTPWINCLGNHASGPCAEVRFGGALTASPQAYGYNVQAQMELGTLYPSWCAAPPRRRAHGAPA